MSCTICHIFLVYRDNIDNIDLGDYTFTDMNDYEDSWITEFTIKDNPDIIFRMNHDRAIVTLLKILDDEYVDVTSWRYCNKVNKVFPGSMFKI